MEVGMLSVWRDQSGTFHYARVNSHYVVIEDRQTGHLVRHWTSTDHDILCGEPLMGDWDYTPSAAATCSTCKLILENN